MFTSEETQGEDENVQISVSESHEPGVKRFTIIGRRTRIDPRWTVWFILRSTKFMGDLHTTRTLIGN